MFLHYLDNMDTWIILDEKIEGKIHVNQHKPLKMP